MFFPEGRETVWRRKEKKGDCDAAVCSHEQQSDILFIERKERSFVDVYETQVSAATIRLLYSLKNMKTF